MSRGVGIYVHFPWCLAKCPYCDFVSYARSRESIDHRGYADAVIRELELRASSLLDEWGGNVHLSSVFFGGGTPSLWEPAELGRLLRTLGSTFPSRPDGEEELEVTVECNPSSLDFARACALHEQGVNRLSVGVQGLDDERLRFLGRLHSGDEAIRSVEAALRSGVARVSADLIYAVASQTAATAAKEALTLAALGLRHISAYSLTIERGTRFGELSRRGRLPLCDDSVMVDSFFAVEEALAKRGLEHYEVSNYAAQGQESRHNVGYWRGKDYLGLGCGAFGTLTSLNGTARRYRNRVDPAQYARGASCCSSSELLQVGPLVQEFECLTAQARLRERIMLGLRMANGLDLREAALETGVDAFTEERTSALDRLRAAGRVVQDGTRISIPKSQWIWADDTAASLF